MLWTISKCDVTVCKKDLLDDCFRFIYTMSIFLKIGLQMFILEIVAKYFELNPPSWSKSHTVRTVP